MTNPMSSLKETPSTQKSVSGLPWGNMQSKKGLKLKEQLVLTINKEKVPELVRN
jgi:hypothetical protein